MHIPRYQYRNFGRLAELPMHTYAQGSTEGQFSGGTDTVSHKQIIQGFSAVLQTNQENQFYFF